MMGDDVDYVDLLGIGIKAVRSARMLPGIRRERFLCSDQRLEMGADESAGNTDFAGGDPRKLLVEAK